MTPRILFIFLLCFCNQCIAQEKKELAQDNGQLQQTLLLSRKQQLEQSEQNKQKQLYEQQKLALSEQEKQLMQLKFEKNKRELELEKKNAQQIAQQVQLQSRMREYVKDEEIRAQEKELLIKRKWNFYLTVLFF